MTLPLTVCYEEVVSVLCPGTEVPNSTEKRERGIPAAHQGQSCERGSSNREVPFMSAFTHSTWYFLWTRRVWLLTGLTTPTLAGLGVKVSKRRYCGILMKRSVLVSGCVGSSRCA